MKNKNKTIDNYHIIEHFFPHFGLNNSMWLLLELHKINSILAWKEKYLLSSQVYDECLGQ